MKNILRNIEEADNNIFATDPALLQIQLSFCVYYSGTEVNGKSARIRKELGLQDLVLMCKLNHFLPSAMDHKCGLSEQRLKGRGGLSRATDMFLMTKERAVPSI